MSKKNHWENVYDTKTPEQVSWTQKIPSTSLGFINSFEISKNAKIIDIGGGDSNLVDHLLDLGYENITVLDISAKALERAQKRLGEKAHLVNWIVSDITHFEPKENYDIWHDRAAFHFLTNTNQIEKYLEIAKKCVKNYMIIGTFSENGPTKCSGLDIKQYTEEKMSNLFANDFEKINSVIENHTTPFNTIQNFLFCSFKKK